MTAWFRERGAVDVTTVNDGGRPGHDARRTGSEGRWSLAVDPIACDGYGMCAELVPELIALDDWGYPMLAPGEVPGQLLAHARRAVDACPVLALKLHRMAVGDSRSPERTSAVAASAGSSVMRPNTLTRA